MAAHDNPRLSQKFQPWRNSTGSTTNNTSEGSTSQKMSVLSAATFAESPVSRYSQTIASKDVTGKEASSAPSRLLRRATSEIAAISSAEMKILISSWLKEWAGVAQRTMA